MQLVASQISDFLVTLNMGLGWIADAGKKLVAILDKDPNAYDDILEVSSATWLTKEVLLTIEAIGRGQVAPDLLMLPMHVLNRLAVLPTEQQIKAMQGVEVATPPRNGKGAWNRTSKPASKLTPREAQRAIGPEGLRSAEQQIGVLTRTKGCVLGKYMILIQDGQDPLLVDGDCAPDYEKQRVKVVGGKALIELYL
jgi:hypothetical protein